MQTSGVGAYALQVRYEQQTMLFRQESSVNNGRTSQAMEYLATSRSFEFTLEIQGAAKPQFGTQAEVADFLKGMRVDWESQKFEGRSIYELTPEEAEDLVSEEGFWGVTKTAQRLADFVLKGGGEDLDRLRAGRAGILKGFEEAEKIWGDKLPEISYKTMEAALASIDDRIRELGGSVLDAVA